LDPVRDSSGAVVVRSGQQLHVRGIHSHSAGIGGGRFGLPTHFRTKHEFVKGFWGWNPEVIAGFPKNVNQHLTEGVTTEMDKDRVKGKIKDIKGRVERQVAEWTGDKDAQAEGTKEQIKGKVQNVFGKIKDAGREAVNKIERKNQTPADQNRNRDDEDVA
jgi:uncharacterized protein YjbJ (UPF0337 family)